MGSVGRDHHDPQLATALSSNEAADMATLDCSKLKGSPSERSAALGQLDEALQTYGFIYLANHGVSQALFDEAFSWISRLSKIHAIEADQSHTPSAFSPSILLPRI